MPVGTFMVGIVVALAVGIVLASTWFRTKQAQATAEQARRSAEESTRPIADTLVRLEAQMRDIEAQRQRMFGGLEHQLDSLSRETVTLSQALRVPNARGRWGELTLRRVAELAGMVPHCDFFEQETGGSQRPDMIVRLPGNRTLAVDAKVPLSAYLDAEAAPDEPARDAALVRHGQQVSRHMLTLSGREYWAQFQPAPEMVVLFLAGDHFLSAALEKDPELLERALARRVLIATPVTLISVLKGVAYGWRQEKLAQNAEEIRRIGAEFYERLRVFGETYADAGRHLAKALDVYNRSAGSWDSRVLPSLRRMKDLGAGGTTEVPQIPHIDAAARDPQSLPRRPE
jgi:DNA recombination protein RmuC